MEVFIPCNTSTREGLSHKDGSSRSPHTLSCCNARDLNMNELKTCLAEFYSMSGLCLSPGRKALSNNGSDGYKSDESNMSSSASNKFFSKSIAFTSFGEPKTLAGEMIGGTEISDVNKWSNPFCIVSVPAPVTRLVFTCGSCTARKLVSAMKGSRVKQGIAPKKLSVTWASDVYDPIPTSVSHAPSDRNQHYGNGSKKYWKNKQKGGSKLGRSSNGKAKKQTRKNNGNASKLRSI